MSPAAPGARGETEAVPARERGGVRAAAARGVPRPARSRVPGGAAPSPAAGPQLRFPGDLPPPNGALPGGEERGSGTGLVTAQLEPMKVPVWLQTGPSL